jgi:hypothetical protein
MSDAALASAASRRWLALENRRHGDPLQLIND